jgi:hypothetical protein
MAKGSKTISLGSTDKKKRSFEPFPAGDYDLKILGDTVEIKTPNPSKRNENPVSYVSLGFEALGTAAEDGGKNRRLYHSFWCKTAPGKDGIASFQCVDQLKGFADAIGDQPELKVIEQAGQEVISQLDVKKFLQSHDGDVVRAHVAIQKGSKDYPDPKNVVKEFMESEESADEDEDEDEDEKDEETDDDEDGDDDESDDDDDELEKAVKKPLKKKGKK